MESLSNFIVQIMTKSWNLAYILGIRPWSKFLRETPLVGHVTADVSIFFAKIFFTENIKFYIPLERKSNFLQLSCLHRRLKINSIWVISVWSYYDDVINFWEKNFFFKILSIIYRWKGNFMLYNFLVWTKGRKPTEFE